MWGGWYGMGWAMWLFMGVGLVGLWTAVFLLIRLTFADRRERPHAPARLEEPAP